MIDSYEIDSDYDLGLDITEESALKKAQDSLALSRRMDVIKEKVKQRKKGK